MLLLLPFTQFIVYNFSFKRERVYCYLLTSLKKANIDLQPYLVKKLKKSSTYFVILALNSIGITFVDIKQLVFNIFVALAKKMKYY